MRGRRLLLCGSAAAAVLSGWALTPDEPMVELLSKPGLVPVTDATPEFSWLFAEALPGDRQTAYQVQVASTTLALKTNAPDLWDSGRVASDQSLFVPYAGKPLPAGSNVFWRVCVWDRKQARGAWSQVREFALAESLGADAALRYPLEVKQVKPLRVVTNAQKRVFVDFGKVAFGWVELMPPRETAKGPFVLHLGEKAVGGTVDTNPGGSVRYAKVRGALTTSNVYRVPLTADGRNTGGDAVQLPKDLGVVMPFRYVEVEECPFPVTADSIRQMAVFYPFDESASTFGCSDKSLARVFDLCKYSIKATSFAGVYVDGDRERIPYEADAYIAQLGHYCTDREFTLARYSHEYLMQHPTWPTEWRQHSVMMAWADWMYTGDAESVERCYEALKTQKLLSAYARDKDGLLVTGGAEASKEGGMRDIVDWPEGERDGFEFRPVNAVVNAFYCRNLQQMADFAQALGKREEADGFRAKAERAAQSFHAAFFDAARGRYVDGEGASHASLHANMLPLAFGLVPAAERARVADYVQSRDMSCSVYGAQYLLEALFAAGREDAALKLLTRDSLRSWQNMIRAGATVTAEAWDLRLKPNEDWNHVWGAAPANIVPRFVLGVRPIAPGFGKLLIKPQLGSSLREACGKVPTVRGPVSVCVEQKPGRLYRLVIDTPVNTTARVEVPAGADGAVLRCDGSRTSPALEDGRWVLEGLTSGRHTVVWMTKEEEAACGSDGETGVRRIFGRCWRAWLPFF